MDLRIWIFSGLTRGLPVDVMRGESYDDLVRLVLPWCRFFFFLNPNLYSAAHTTRYRGGQVGTTYYA